MRPTLRALAAIQGGVFTRRQAKLDGCSEREIKTRTGPHGDWVTVRRGVYAERVVWEGTDDVGRYELEVRAVGLVTEDTYVYSHTSAATLWNMPTRPRWYELVHVTRPDVLGGRVEGGVKHHKGWWGDDVVMLDELPVTSLARTAMDVARELGFEDGVVAADAALRLGATQHEIGAVLQRMGSWPHVTRARAAADAADGGAETIGETLTRLLVLELGIGRPETQFEVWSEGRHAFVDLKLRRHFIEFDGKIKYLGRERGGVRDGQDPDEVLWSEKRREDWLRRYDGGHGMSRVIWSELMPAQREATKRRILREFMTSQQRFGGLGR